MYPWDFYLRQHFIASNRRIGAALLENDRAEEALEYLQYASHWGADDASLELARIYRDGLTGHVDPERADQLQALASRQSMRRFTVPVSIEGHGVWDFHVYVLEWPEDYPYMGIDDQVVWAQEMRGLSIPEDVQEAFRALHRIARENNVSFPDLAVYALGNADAEDSDDAEAPEDPEQ
ncbi:MAG: DUF2610 domain-containing protein [Alphaproteobacteria bacterium]|jgi:TPR repeat protein|nr:DUF2610 domain-containing protein [Alphaproteobacteria bacterium]